MSRFLRQSLGPGFGYVPGEQPTDGHPWVKLNTNESPLPPSPAVSDAVRDAATLLNRYPSASGEPLRGALAAHHRVDRSQVVVGNGADALIESCLRAFCDPGSTLVLTDPTYSLLPVAARLHGVRTSVVPLGVDGFPPAEFAASPGAMRVIVNPNTPTGTWLPAERLAAALEGAGGVVVIDEAYADFSPASCLPMLADHPSWLVLRTFSKAHALAGLRVGYAVGAGDLVADLVAVGESYPVDHCALAGALAALEDEAHHRRIIDGVLAERERVGADLLAWGWSLTASRANFLCGLPATGTAKEVAARLREQRVLVRHFDHGDRGLLRITIGSRTENDAFLAAAG